MELGPTAIWQIPSRMAGIDLWRYPDLLEIPRDCTYESNEEVLMLLEMRWRGWLQVGGKLAHEIHLPLSAIRDIHDYMYGGGGISFLQILQ